MIFDTIDRLELTELLTTGSAEQAIISHTARRSLDRTNLRKGFVQVVWREVSGRNVLTDIIVQDGGVKDFLAWSSTYIRTHQPISSFFRIWEASEFISEPQEIAPVDCIAAAAKLTIGEVFSLSKEPVSEDTLSLNACKSTASYVFAQLVTNGARAHVIEKSIRRWEAARNALGQSNSSIPTENLLHYFEIALHILDPGKDLFSNGDFIGSQKDSGIRHETTILETLISRGERALSKSKIMAYIKGVESISGTKEERMTSFKLQLSKMDSAKRTKSSPFDSAFIALMAYRISPNNLDYLPLLQSNEKKYPMVCMWYTLFSVSGQPSPTNYFKKGISQHIVRDVLADANLNIQTSADISFDELLMHSNINSKLEPSKIGLPHLSKIEIQPGAVSFIRTGKSPSNVTSQDYKNIGHGVDIKNEIAQIKELIQFIERKSRT